VVTIRALGSVVLALALLVDCRATEPRQVACTTADACVAVLCDAESDAPALADAALMISGDPKTPARATAARFTACAGRALDRVSLRSEIPDECGFEHGGFSVWDVALVGGVPQPVAAAFGACAPRAAFFMSVSSAWTADPSVRDMLRRGLQSPSRWAMRLARRSLLAGGDPAALDATALALKASDAGERAKAVDDFAAAAGFGRPYVSAIASAHAHLALRDRWLVAFALARIGGTEAGERLALLLQAPAPDTEAIVSACEQLGPDAVAAAPELEVLARTHPFRALRESAAAAYEAATGEYVAPGPGTCPRSVQQRGQRWEVELAHRTLTLAPTALAADDPTRRTEAGACAHWFADAHASAVFQQRTRCLIGFDRGEFGGWVEARLLDDSRPQRLQSANAVRFVADGRGGVLVVSGLAHLMFSGTWIDRLEPDQRGDYRSRRLAEVPGTPLAHELESGALVLLTQGTEPGCKDNESLLVRVHFDGRIEALE
jgi:hypothetical protein